MFPSLKECEVQITLPNKITMIIATCQSDIKTMMASIFSLLLRSSHNLEHLIVAINGADPRLGNIALQDKKQQFLEELRSLKWKNKDMPLTVIRVWSRIGHAEALEMGIPWVHTEYYGIMHDDVIIDRNDWAECALSSFDNNPNMVIACTPPLLSVSLHAADYNGYLKLGFPNLNTTFIICRKNLMTELGARWCGHHLAYNLDWEKINKNDFKELYTKIEQFANSKNDKYKSFNLDEILSKKFQYISLDIGAWVFAKLFNNKLDFSLLPNDTVYHIGGQSWGRKKPIKIATITTLENELSQYPEYWKLYNKFKD